MPVPMMAIFIVADSFPYSFEGKSKAYAHSDRISPRTAKRLGACGQSRHDSPLVISRIICLGINILHSVSVCFEDIASAVQVNETCLLELKN